MNELVAAESNADVRRAARYGFEEHQVTRLDIVSIDTAAELVLVANRNRLASDKAYADAVRRFVKSLVAGTNAARRDPSGATQIMEQVSQYKVAFLQRSVPYTLTLLAPPAGQKTGCINEASWQSFGDWMKQNKLIKVTPNAALISTDKYMPYSC